MVNTARWYIGDGALPENRELTDRLLDGSARLAPEKTLCWVRRFATPSSALFNPALASEMNAALLRTGMKSLNLPALNSPEFKRIDLFEGVTPKPPGKAGPLLRHLLLAVLSLLVLWWVFLSLSSPPYIWDRIAIFVAIGTVALFGLYESVFDMTRIFRRR